MWCFTAVGGFPERFLNLTARSGEVLWDVSCKNRVFTASTFARRYKAARVGAASQACATEGCKKRGLPFLLHRYRRRAGVFVGILVFLCGDSGAFPVYLDGQHSGKRARSRRRVAPGAL